MKCLPGMDSVRAVMATSAVCIMPAVWKLFMKMEFHFFTFRSRLLYTFRPTTFYPADDLPYTFSTLILTYCQCCESKIIFFGSGFGFGSGLNLTFGSGSGLSMKNTFELHICRSFKHHKKMTF